MRYLSRLRSVVLSIALSILALTAIGQKNALKAADDELQNYEVSRLNKLTAAAGLQSLNNAKNLIDAASFKPGSASATYAYALKAAIYSAFTVSGDKTYNIAELYTVAKTANDRAKDADAKGKYKKLIDYANLNMSLYNFGKGQEEFKRQNFKAAYLAFDAAREIAPGDTSLLKYTALSAANAGVKEPGLFRYAVENYSVLLLLDENQKPQVYDDLATLYVVTKDTLCAIRTINSGLIRYPQEKQLYLLEIPILLHKEQYESLIPVITNAISIDPKNKLLYYYGGLAYDKKTDLYNKKMPKSYNQLKNNSLEVSKLGDYKLAVEMYKAALKIDVNYFDANLNLGALLLKTAISIYNEAYALPDNKRKDFETMVANANVQFDLARPYLQRAVNLNQGSKDALMDLRNYYLGKTDKLHAKENSERAALLKKQIDLLN